MTEVIKDTFETRMKIREFDTDIRKLKERIDRIEGSFPAIVDRLKWLERK